MTTQSDVAKRLLLATRETPKEHGKEPGCNLSANSRASQCRAGWPKTVCYFCVLFSVPSKPLHALLHPDTESGYTPHFPVVSRGGLPIGTCTRQLVRDKPFCRLRIYFRRCSVHSWFCSTPGAKGRRKAAPALLQPGKQKSPVSSRSVHTEMPICFQNQILHGSIEQRQHFLLSGHLPFLCLRETTARASWRNRKAQGKYTSSEVTRAVGQPQGGTSPQEEQGKDHCSPQYQCKLLASLPVKPFQPDHHIWGTSLVSHAKTQQQSSAPQNCTHTRGNDLIFLRCKFLDLASWAALMYTKTRLCILAISGKNTSQQFKHLSKHVTFPCIQCSYHSAEGGCENGKCHRHSFFLQVSSFLWIWQLLQTT